MVRPAEKGGEKKLASGIIIPETVDKEKLLKGEVIAVGPGKILENGGRSQMDVKAGDHVIMKSWGGDDVELEKEEYKIVSQDDILAVVDK